MRVTTASNETHSVADWAPAWQPLPEGGPGPRRSQDKEQELPSESTWQERSVQPDAAAFLGPRALPTWTAAAAATGYAAPSPARSLDAQSVTVLIGGIHAVHRQRQLERAGSGGSSFGGPTGAARRLSSVPAEATAMPAAAQQPAAELPEAPGTTATDPPAATTAAAAAAPVRPQSAVRASHMRQPSTVPGVTLRQEDLGKCILPILP
jgi:hypothetical protein